MNLCIALLVTIGWLGWLAFAYLMELPNDRALLRTVFYAFVSVDIISVAGKLLLQHVTSLGAPQLALILFCFTPFPLIWSRFRVLTASKQEARAEYRRREE